MSTHAKLRAMFSIDKYVTMQDFPRSYIQCANNLLIFILLVANNYTNYLLKGASNAVIPLQTIRRYTNGTKCNARTDPLEQKNAEPL